MTSASASPALHQVFEEYGPFVWRTLRYLGVAEREVDDVFQDVFLAVHRKLGGFEGRSSLRTWMYGICMRVASDHRNRAWVRREVPTEALPEAVVGASQDEELDRGRARALLLSILDGLDEDKRAVFVLYEIEELPMNEVARVVGCPLQTAYSRLHAARERVVEVAKRMGARERAQ